MTCVMVLYRGALSRAAIERTTICNNALRFVMFVDERIEKEDIDVIAAMVCIQPIEKDERAAYVPGVLCLNHRPRIVSRGILYRSRLETCRHFRRHWVMVGHHTAHGPDSTDWPRYFVAAAIHIGNWPGEGQETLCKSQILYKIDTRMRNTSGYIGKSNESTKQRIEIKQSLTNGKHFKI